MQAPHFGLDRPGLLHSSSPGRDSARAEANGRRDYDRPGVTDADHDDSADAATMAEIAAGDDEALRRLYERYGRIVYAVSYRVTTDAQLAEECTQDVFVRVWRRARDYEPARAKVSTWLFAIARNRAIELWRARSRRPLSAIDPDAVSGTAARDGVAVSDDPAEIAAAADEAIRVAEAMALLPPEQHEALQLVYFDGLSQAEIASRLDLPLGTVKGRVRLGLARLRGLADDFQLEPNPQ